MYSKTVIVGNLARDPESRKAGETNVTRLVVAVNDARQKDKVSYIDVDAWSKLGDVCQQYLTKGRQVLAEGRLVNLAAAEGHPSEVMDMSFANQFLSLCRLAAEGKQMDAEVYDITLKQDMDLATTKLATLGFTIDELTEEQIAYSTDYTAGT